MFSRFLLTLVLLGLVNSAAIGGDHREAFSRVRVDRAKLAIASRALERTSGFKNLNYSLVNDVLEGVKEENLDTAADLVCLKLGWINRDCVKIRNNFKAMAVAKKTTAAFEVEVVVNELKSIYGYMTGVRNSQGDVDIAYTIHEQEFAVENMEFSRGEMGAMKMHLKHDFLLNLKQENIIHSISYV